eukprot:7645677-Heterocapsa_arctica.AAC.1
MARRNAAARLDALIRERMAARGEGGAGDGTVDASVAAEAEIARDLLDTRVYEGTTSWNDCSR